MSTAERFFKEVQSLPDTLAQEVLDFIEYIEIKHGLRDRLPRKIEAGAGAGDAPRMGQPGRRGLGWRVSLTIWRRDRHRENECKEDFGRGHAAGAGDPCSYC